MLASACGYQFNSNWSRWILLFSLKENRQFKENNYNNKNNKNNNNNNIILFIVI